MTMKTNNKKTAAHLQSSLFEIPLEEQSYDLGKYRFGDVIELSYEHATNPLHKMHEIGHYTLAKTTFWGITIKYLTVFATKDIRIKDLVSIMKYACEEVFESYSVALQYVFAIKSNDETAKQQVKNSLYHQIYNKDYFDIVEMFSCEQILSFPFHTRLARLALSVKLDDIYESKVLKSKLIDNPQIHPDNRFKKLVLSLKELLKQKQYYEITDEDILFNCNLSSYSQSENDLYDFCNVLKNKLLQAFPENKNLISKIRNCEIVIEEEPFEKYLKDNYYDIAIPTSGGEHYTTEYLENIPPLLNIFNVMLVYFDKPYKGLHICILYNTYHHARCWFFFQEKDYNRIFECFEGELIIQYTDIEKYQSINQQSHKRVFCYFPVRYSKFKNYIKNYTEPTKNIFIHRLPPTISTIFVKGKNNLILFSPQFLFVEPEIKNDIKNEFFKFVNCEFSQTDGIFYKSKYDWKKYNNIIKAIFMSFNAGYRVSGDF